MSPVFFFFGTSFLTGLPSSLRTVAKELEQHLITPPVLLGDLIILQIRARGHPPVNLIGEGLDMVLDLEALGEGLDGSGVLILGGEEAEGDGHVGSIGWVDHSGVAGGGGSEGSVGAGSRKGGNLAAPAVLLLREISCVWDGIWLGVGRVQRTPTMFQDLMEGYLAWAALM